ncbi:hypothetical protein HDU92_002303 [Lobulomyces angularis]|nr:hypothetical protein HDU92_002303 [Lobulomyces angularis]
MSTMQNHPSTKKKLHKDNLESSLPNLTIQTNLKRKNSHNQDSVERIIKKTLNDAQLKQQQPTFTQIQLPTPYGENSSEVVENLGKKKFLFSLTQDQINAYLPSPESGNRKPSLVLQTQENGRRPSLLLFVPSRRGSKNIANLTANKEDSNENVLSGLNEKLSDQQVSFQDFKSLNQKKIELVEDKIELKEKNVLPHSLRENSLNDMLERSKAEEKPIVSWRPWE